MHRWVRYTAPVMVCVLVDGDDARVVNVVVGETGGDLQIANDEYGRPLIFDEEMRPVGTDELPAAIALNEAQYGDWPKPSEWDGGPDAKRRPELYAPVTQPA